MGQKQDFSTWTKITCWYPQADTWGTFSLLRKFGSPLMDCWHFIAPLIPVNTDYTMDIYIMVFNALKDAEKKRIAEKERAKEEQQQ